MARIHFHKPQSFPKRRNILRPRHKRKIKLLIKKLFWLGIVVFLILIIYLVGAFAWYSRSLPDPNKILERNVAQSTKLYDRDGQSVLYDVHGTEKRTLVKLENIPDYVKWATISAEDRHFYEHKGFNLLAMFKGVIIDPLLGRRARGGSTLTQQFVKNAILTNERRVSRKIKEFVLSARIEKVFSKDEILQMYLNEIPYGSVSYGIQSASQTYFNKDVSELSLAESAVLVALPQAPTFYSPYGSHVDGLLVRQKYVLDQMVDNGYIDEAEATAAKLEKIEFAIKREAITAPHFVMYVKEILSEKFGEDLVETGGLKVTTTLDMEKQRFAEEAVANGVDARGQSYGFHNAALISLDPRNGQILAMVGSKDYFDLENDGNVNVTLSLRQPGSSIKPLVYAAAFAKGYTPNTVLQDVETTFKTEIKDYHPKNYDLQERGPVTIRQALGNSLNIPAVKALYLTGVQNVIDVLEMFGYTSFEDRSRFGLSLVLGGGEVRLIEHAAAYGALANQGVYYEPAVILKVEDSRGNVLYEYKEKKRRALDANIVNMVTEILADGSVRLSANLSLAGRPAAAKTGTTNDYHDAWTIGYTPSLVAGVWAGNNDNSEMARGAAGATIAAPIWKEYMDRALAGSSVENFPAVEIPATGKPVLDGVISPERIVRIDRSTGKLATDLTPPAFVEEKVYREAHCVLHYVYKDDPTGGAPEDPAGADPAYQYWEEAVQSWLSRTSGEGATNELPPTEFDDIHTEVNKPTVFIDSPQNNTSIGSSSAGAYLNADVNASAPRGISRVEYYLGNKKIATNYNYPYNLHYGLTSYFVKGSHNLRAVAYDDVDNSNYAEVRVNISVDFPPPSLDWQSPDSGESFSTADFPVSLRGRLTDLPSSAKVNFYYRKTDTGSVDFLGAVILPQSQNVAIDLPALYESGEYEIYAEIVDPNGEKHQSSRLDLIVN